MWLQYDFGDGPVIGGVKTTLFVAWLAWSRFRVVLAIRDKTSPSVMAALGRCERHRCGNIVQTHTGPLSIAAAGAQIAAVPICAIVGLTAFIAFAR